tara:strand:- start:773 stop:1063 length:291 start_codon:yes stop_codon:yes gene_type:complete
MNNKHKKGFINHLIAIQWLTKKGYFVFNNISSLGCCDVIALNTEGETLLIDIKTATRRRDKSIINRVPTKQQNKMKVNLLMVDEKGNCKFIKCKKS